MKAHCISTVMARKPIYIPHIPTILKSCPIVPLATTPLQFTVMTYIDKIERDRFAVLEGLIDSETLDRIEKELQHIEVDHLASQRAGKAFGLRNLMTAVPLTRKLANS